ncbi:MAG: DUF3616 domain-containing protein [Cyanobacteria bacterium CRU_2_1]|nr:DUF3616 domain-containing protein [Cyanobacteria bacterium RU_5_0]NJR63832.1 DUF3616 domain-containing protein [Cyanobacteria bacterium CRU_2_1]
MSAGYLLNRILLEFKDDLVHQDLSTVTIADNHLWMASDETTAIERLSQIDPWTFGNQESFELENYLDQFSQDDKEIDIEGLDYRDGYLWLIGSHSTKRKKAKVDNIENLTKIKTEKNRYLLARIPLDNGELKKSHENRTAAYLERNEDGNLLMTALKKDDYLKPFLIGSLAEPMALPGKENGFDIEGLAVYQNKIFIGLRGPVLRGVAIILEIETEESKSGFLKLKPIDKNGGLYKKHFLELDGLGIRELCVDKSNLLVLAGPSMDLDGTLRLFRWHNPIHLPNNSFSKQKEGELERLFDIPHGYRTDKAEGLTLFSSLDRPSAILVVYDSPDEQRQVGKGCVLADVFTLK